MNTLSVCLIVKDEALTLKRALENAASIADEIVVVDTGSSDNSKQIAQKYANVYDFLWQDDFSAARNEGIKKCKCDLIMWLDADDVIPEETVQKILALKQNCSYDMVMLPYEVGNLRFFRERIFRNDGTHFFAGEVHEAIQPKGKIGYLDAPIVHDKKKPHDKYRNLRILQKVAAKRKLNDRELFYYVSELYFTGDESAKSELWRFMKEIATPKPVQRKKADIATITREMRIEKDFVCSEKHRAFFKEQIGKGFSFNVAFQKWLKGNAGKTYEDAINAYYQILEDKKKSTTTIDKQFEYNTYIRDFFKDNKGRSLEDAIKCWKYKKQRQGHNRYEKADLAALGE